MFWNVLINTDSLINKSKLKVEIEFNNHFLLFKAYVNFLGEYFTRNYLASWLLRKFFIFLLTLPWLFYFVIVYKICLPFQLTAPEAKCFVSLIQHLVLGLLKSNNTWTKEFVLLEPKGNVNWYQSAFFLIRLTSSIN